MNRELRYSSEERDTIHMPREAYIGEGTGKRGENVYRFAIPHLPDVPGRRGFYVEFPQKDCKTDFGGNIEIYAPFEISCPCYLGDTLDIRCKDMCDARDLRNWEIEWACREFSPSRFAAARKDVVSQRYDVTEVAVKKSDIARDDGRLCETKPYCYNGKTYTLVFDKRDCRTDDSKDFVSCRLPARTPMFPEGLRAKDIKAMAEGKSSKYDTGMER